MNTSFHDRLKGLRKEKKMTQSELGTLLGYGYTTIANYESGRNQPRIADLKKIADIFDVSLDYLLCVSDMRKMNVPKKNMGDLENFLFYYMQLNLGSLQELLSYMKWLSMYTGQP